MAQRLLVALLSGATDDTLRRLKDRFGDPDTIPGADPVTKGCLRVIYSGGVCDVSSFDLRSGGVYHDSLRLLGLGDSGGVGASGPHVSGDEADGEACRLVVELARERDRQTLLVATGKAMADLTTGALEPASVADELREAAASVRSPKAPPTLDEYVTATQRELTRIADRGGVELTLGMGEFDSYFTFRRANLVTVGAFTSHGKTAFSTRATVRGLKAGLYVAYLCFEDYGTWLLKFACQLSGRPLSKYTSYHQTSDSEKAETMASVELARQFQTLRVLPPMRLSEFEAELSRGPKPDLLVLDYCQKYVEQFGSEDKRNAASKVTSDFQDLVRKFDAFGIMTSQLSRPSSPNGKPIRRPEIRLLKESGDIENYSDAVLLLYWPWRDSLDGNDLERDRYEITIAKNKLGECRRVDCLFDGATLSFRDRFTSK